MQAHLCLEFLAHLVVLDLLPLLIAERHPCQIELTTADKRRQCLPAVLSDAVVFFLQVREQQKPNFQQYALPLFEFVFIAVVVGS